jgi:hypothetical protein
MTRVSGSARGEEAVGEVLRRLAPEVPLAAARAARVPVALGLLPRPPPVRRIPAERDFARRLAVKLLPPARSTTSVRLIRLDKHRLAPVPRERSEGQGNP